MSASRTAEIVRNTNETKIRVVINLDGSGRQKLATGIPFLDHMLDQIARHGLIDLEVEADGDLQIDAHHTVEDIGIAIGQALAQAIGNKSGIRRYGHAYVPLDESLSRVVIDFSGRPYLEFQVPFVRATSGTFDLDLVREFFQGLVNHAKISLHIDNLRGETRITSVKPFSRHSVAHCVWQPSRTRERPVRFRPQKEHCNRPPECAQRLNSDYLSI